MSGGSDSLSVKNVLTFSPLALLQRIWSTIEMEARDCTTADIGAWNAFANVSSSASMRKRNMVSSKCAFNFLVPSSSRSGCAN